jgi:poly(A) polymerase
MIQKLIRRILNKKSAASGKATILPLRKHGITRDRISPCALKVCEELRAQNFAAFVVGGAVRDLV